jgi:hypothetical protein
MDNFIVDQVLVQYQSNLDNVLNQLQLLATDINPLLSLSENFCHF